MKHILMIATGGTIASKETADGLAPQLTSEELLAEVPELEQLCRIDTVQLMNRDSTNINSRDWLQMAACVREHYDAYDGFVLTHGTDTMAYTAAALSYLVQNNAKPVVITGSQKSIFNQDTDARENLRDAFLYACDDGACGVHIVFDHKVILGTRARKVRTKSYNAFRASTIPRRPSCAAGRSCITSRSRPQARRSFTTGSTPACSCSSSFPASTPAFLTISRPITARS